MSEIASKTSSTIATGGADEGDELKGALFDETAAAYQRLRIRSQGIIVDTITYNLRDALRPYTRINPWASLSNANSGNDTALTAELDGPIRLLDEYFSFLSKALGKAPIRRIGRNVAQSIQAYLWDNVLARHSFSTAGALQFVVDVEGLWSVLDRYIDAGAGRSAMKRLHEGLTLLSLPTKGEVSAQEDLGEDEKGQRTWGLFEVERRVFMNNEEARVVLEEMGLEALTENDARTALEKRIELIS